MEYHTPWATRAANLLRNGRCDEELPLPLHLNWKKRIAQKNIWASPIVVEGSVYIAAGSGLSVIEVENGALQWKLDEAVIHESGSPTIWQNLLFVAGMHNCWAIDRDRRKVQWQYAISKLISRCAPAVTSDKVIWGATDGWLYALDIQSGALRWQFNAVNWIKFAPSILENMVYFATEAGGVYALDTADGTLVWERHFPGSLGYNTTAAIEQGKIVICIQQVGVLALDAQTGETIWHYKTPYGPWTAPCIADGMVFAADWQIHAINFESGQRVWIGPEMSLHNSAPVSSGNTIFIGGGHQPFVYGIDRHTGQKVWEFETGDMVFSTPAVASGKLLVGCHDGYLYCFTKKGI